MKLLSISQLVSLLLFASSSYGQVLKIKAETLFSQIQSNSAAVIIDVRSEQEFADGHIQGAINLPYDQIEQQQISIVQYADKPVVIYCRSGRRAQVAEDTLTQLGFKQLYDLQGHYLNWIDKNYPVIKP